MRCPHCGYANSPGQKFCGNCGRPLQAASSAEGERKLVTILFADIAGSTAAAEKLDPEDWREIVSGVHRGVGQAVDRYGGTVVQLLGDGLLAFFGAPVAHEDDAERAVLAALDSQAFVAHYSQQVASTVDKLQIRVGVNTGLVVVGNMGMGQHVEYLAVGDSVNLAARMQEAAQPGEILLSADTYRLVKHLFNFEFLGAIEVKGKSLPVEAYRAAGRKQTPGSARGLEGLDAPLVGRDTELRVLSARLDALRAGQGAVVAVVGEAGIGKSRLVAEMRKLVLPASPLEVLWLESRAISYGHSISYHLWRQIIRESIGAHESDSPAAVRQKLGDLSAVYGLSPADIPFLQAILNVEGQESLAALSGYEGDMLVDRVTEAGRSYLRALADLFPTVLVLDDLHWADDASLDLLSNVAPLVFEHRLLIVAILRPDPHARIWELKEQQSQALGSQYEEISLEPLGTDTARFLMDNLLHATDLPENVARTILKKADGNPFFLEEVLRSLIDGGYFVRENAHWRAVREIANVTIPDSLAGILSARIDRLPEDSKRVAQMASVIGRIFSYPVLKAICDSAPTGERIANLKPHLDTLTQEELVRQRAADPELEYIFKHALTQEAAYNSLLIRRRKEYHRRAAEALERIYAGRLQEYSPTLAFHLWQAEEWLGAGEYSLRAGNEAMRIYARSEALEHYERALQAFDKVPQAPHQQRVDTVLAWVQAALNARPYDKLLERLLQAEQAARQHDDKPRLAQVLHWIANVHFAHGFPTRGFPALSENYHLATEIGNEQLSVFPSWYMAWAMIDKNPRQALEHLEHVIELARKYHDRGIEAHAYASKAMAHARLGEQHLVDESVQCALELVRSTKSAIKTAEVNLMAGFAYLDTGDVNRGLEHGKLGLEQAQAAGSLECTSTGFFCVGMAQLQTQNVREAIRALQESVRFSEMGTMAFMQTQQLYGFGVGGEMRANQSRAGLAIARYNAGESGAVEEMEAALAAVQALGDPYTAALLAESLGQAYASRGQYTRAKQSLQTALDYYGRTDMRPYRRRAAAALAAVEEQFGWPINA